MFYLFQSNLKRNKNNESIFCNKRIYFESSQIFKFFNNSVFLEIMTSENDISWKTKYILQKQDYDVMKV